MIFVVFAVEKLGVWAVTMALFCVIWNVLLGTEFGTLVTVIVAKYSPKVKIRFLSFMLLSLCGVRLLICFVLFGGAIWLWAFV